MSLQEKKSSHGLCWVIFIVLGLFLGASMLGNGVLLIGLLAKSGGGSLYGEQGEDEFPQLAERLSYGSGETKVVRIQLTGFIGREAEDSLFMPTYDKVEMIMRQIRAASHDEAVRAIILEVDSPGGGVTPSDEIYQALMDFKKNDPDRKVIIHMKDMAASGAYLVSMAGDWIVAEPTALVGSIGVIIQTLNLKGMGEKIGVTDTTIKSGKNKDLLNPFRDVTDEERGILQDLIDSMYQRFFDQVLQGRGLDEDQLTPWADGRVFSSQVALDNQLIDQIGYWGDVVAKTSEILDVDTVRIVRYRHEQSFFDMFTHVKSPLSRVSLMEMQSTRFMYLWRP